MVEIFEGVEQITAVVQINTNSQEKSNYSFIVRTQDGEQHILSGNLEFPQAMEIVGQIHQKIYPINVEESILN